MSAKFGYCKVSISPVRAENRDQAEIVTQLLFGELIHVEEITGSWCKITTFADNYSGWIDVKHFHFLSQKEANRWMDGLGNEQTIIRSLETPWGRQIIVKGSYIPLIEGVDFNIGKDTFRFAEESQAIQVSSIFEVAKEYLNAPYLWGGKTPFGIDCSGLTQMVFRFFGINLPRDASQQVEHGMVVPFDEIVSGDIAFFQNKDGKIIHVGILDGKGSIIHASGCVRIDSLTSEGIRHNENGSLTHVLSVIKRF